MDRSFAARPPAGRLGSSSRRAAAGRGSSQLAALARRLTLLLAVLRSRRRVRIALICALIATPVLAGGWMWLRHSSFVAVQHVRVSGAQGPQAGAIDGALKEAARGMSTLAPDPAKLKAAVARFPQVSEVKAYPSFPHAMRIAVVQRPAVASLLVGGTRIAVSGDGIALGASVPAGSLPTVADDVAPGSGARARNPLVLQALSVFGAAPGVLDRLAERAYFSPRGLTVAMRGGLLVYFGDATRSHAKWLALAAVLADSSAAAAVYVDVRTPERAAAGFTAGAGPHEAGGGETQIGKGESTVAALAEKLAAATPEGRAQSAAGEGEHEAASEAKTHTSTTSEASSGEEAGGEAAPSTAEAEAEPTG
jgi:cell division septal protein FtsQ